jgi:hypothetical protein
MRAIAISVRRETSETPAAKTWQWPTQSVDGQFRTELYGEFDFAYLWNASSGRYTPALISCANPEKHRMTENAKRRVMENLKRRLREYAERTGRGFISATGNGGGHTFADGNHHSSMVAFEDGKDATYNLHVYRGTVFEVIETIEASEDGHRLIRRERIKGIDGNENVLTAELPVSPSIENSPNS